MNIRRAGRVAFGLWSTAQGIDPELYQKYKNYKSYQQSQQVETLSQARSAALSGDFEQAEQHLAAARNMAYAPDEIRAVETLIEEERERRARLAQEERDRKQRLAQEARQRQAAASSPQSTDCIASTSAIWDSNDIIDGTPQQNTDGRCSNGEYYGCIATKGEWVCRGPYTSSFFGAASTNLYRAMRIACGCER